MSIKCQCSPVLDYITSPIIFTAARLEALANHYVFEPLGLTAATVKILALLNCRGAMNASEILKKIGGTKSNVSQRIRLLEKKRLIQKLCGQYQDRRIVKLRITKNGENILKQIVAHFTEYRQELEKYFQAEEIKIHNQFFNKINKLLDNFEKEKIHES